MGPKRNRDLPAGQGLSETYSDATADGTFLG
jgi:hypothetical protein